MWMRLVCSDVGAAAGFLWIVGQVGLFWVRLHPIGLGSIGLRHVTFCSAGQATTSTTSKPGQHEVDWWYAL